MKTETQGTSQSAKTSGHLSRLLLSNFETSRFAGIYGNWRPRNHHSVKGVDKHFVFICSEVSNIKGSCKIFCCQWPVPALVHLPT